MAFLDLFKKKTKKVAEGSTPNLEPISKTKESIELPKPPELPKPRIGVPEIPPIMAPKTLLTPKSDNIEGIIKPPTLPKTMPPIEVPETPQISKPIKPMYDKLSESAIISAKKSHSSSILSPEKKRMAHFDPFGTLKKEKEERKEEIKGSIKEELPAFTDINIKQKEVDAGVNIPVPPHYLTNIGSAREGVAEEERVILRGLRKPIFVEVNDYRKVIEEIKSIKKDSKKSKELVRALGDFKVKNSIKIKNWETGLEKIQRDLIFMDKILFEESGGNKW